MPPKKVKGKGKQEEKAAEKKEEKKETPPPPPAPAREPTPAPQSAPEPEPESEPLPIPVPVSLGVRETHNHLQNHGHSNDDTNGEYGWDNNAAVGGWGNSDDGNGGGGNGGWGGGDGWGETANAEGSEDYSDDEQDKNRHDGVWDQAGGSAPNQAWPSPSQPVQIPFARTPPPVSHTPAPPRPQSTVNQPIPSHDWSAAHQGQAPHQGYEPPPVAQQVYTSASAMANRGAKPAPPRVEQQPPNRPSYFWAPNQVKQPMASTTPYRPPTQPVSAWGQPKNVDPWGSPKPQPKPPPEPARAPVPATAPSRKAWQDWGRQSQVPVAHVPPARPPAWKQPAPSPWATNYDDEDDEYTDDDGSDETYEQTDAWGRPLHEHSGWGADPRKQSKSTNGYPQRGHVPHKHIPPPPPSQPHPHLNHHQQKQIPPPHHYPHASMDGSKKTKKQQKPKSVVSEHEGWANVRDGWGTPARQDGGGDGWGGSASGHDGWGSAGDAGRGGGDNWSNPPKAQKQAWGQNEGWDNQDSSWSNGKGSAQDGWGDDGWGTGKDSRKDEWEKDDGWGDEGDGWGEDEGESEEEWKKPSHNYHQVPPSKPSLKAAHQEKHNWGGSYAESTYHMPSKTLVHAMNGTHIKAHNGHVPSQKMEEYTNVKFLESNGAAFQQVQRAIFGRERKAKDRIHWMFSPHKDERVSSTLDWIQRMEYNLGSYGLHKFLQSRERGALFVNVTFRLENHPNMPVFDWLTFDELQATTDNVIQESLLTCDPAAQVIIFVYLPSPTGNSVAMWRRKVLVPNNTRLRFQQEIMIAKAGLRKDKDYVIHVDELPPKRGKIAHVAAKQTAGKPAVKVSSKPLLVKHQRGLSLPEIPDLTAKKKRRKWWQILRFAD